ncbi:MAG: propanediol utilization protein, partial [Pseudomonadota bacterium]
MHPAPGALLWAPRAARALASLPPAPAFHVVGGLIGPPRRTDPADRQFPDITDLAEDWVKATGDPVQTAALAR